MPAAFRVLAAGKFDVVIATVFNDLERYQSSGNQEFKKISVNLDDASLHFTGLSKRSKVAHLVKEFTELSQNLYKNDEFQQVINDFKINHSEYYKPTL